MIRLIQLIKRIISVLAEVYTQKRFVSRHLQPIIAPYLAKPDGSISDFDLKKITSYYGVGSPVLAGEGLAGLFNKKISFEERSALTYMAAVTGLFDDFYDKVLYPEKDIRSLMLTPKSITPKNHHEKLFIELSLKAREFIPDKKRLMHWAEKVHEAQWRSLQQKETSTQYHLLEQITAEKGGVSLIFYRCAFKGELSPNEETALMEAGGLLQYCNDIFDVYKDIQEGVYTIGTEAKSIPELRKLLIEKIASTKMAFNALLYKSKHQTILRGQLKFICAQSLVALDQYHSISQNSNGIFTPYQYDRKSLICDMAKPKNALKALKYWLSIEL